MGQERADVDELYLGHAADRVGVEDVDLPLGHPVKLEEHPRVVHGPEGAVDDGEAQYPPHDPGHLVAPEGLVVRHPG